MSSQDEMAEQRTELARERTLLAKQRTFAAWVRTGLASVAVGFAAAELLGDLDPQWIVKTAALLLVAAGLVIFVIGFLGYRKTFRKLRRHGAPGVSPWAIAAVTAAMLVAGLLLLMSLLGE